MSMPLLAVSAAAAAGAPNHARVLPGAESVRETARAVLARPEFQLDNLPDDGMSPYYFFLRLLQGILRWVEGLYDWLSGISPLLAWFVIIALTISLVLLVGHIIWTISMVIRGDRRALRSLEESERKTLDPAELLKQADEANARGNPILGVRLLYRACLARLEQTERKPLRPSATNREHLNRYRATPLYDSLARLVSIIDLKWYGAEPCVPADFAECRQAYERVCFLTGKTAHA
jgi:Domain of unknown function (DUF4129)